MKAIDTLTNVIHNQWLASLLLLLIGIGYIVRLLVKARIDLEKEQFKSKNTIDEKVIGVIIDNLPNLSYLKDLSMLISLIRSEFTLNREDHEKIKDRLDVMDKKLDTLIASGLPK
jgi:putative Mn2+ efflux pump MntP